MEKQTGRPAKETMKKNQGQKVTTYHEASKIKSVVLAYAQSCEPVRGEAVGSPGHLHRYGPLCGGRLCVGCMVLQAKEQHTHTHICIHVYLFQLGQIGISIVFRYHYNK